MEYQKHTLDRKIISKMFYSLYKRYPTAREITYYEENKEFKLESKMEKIKKVKVNKLLKNKKVKDKKESFKKRTYNQVYGDYKTNTMRLATTEYGRKIQAKVCYVYIWLNEEESKVLAKKIRMPTKKEWDMWEVLKCYL